MHFHIPIKSQIPLFAGLALMVGSGFVQSTTVVHAQPPSVNPPAPSKHHGYSGSGGVHSKVYKAAHPVKPPTPRKPRAPKKSSTDN